jgi:hypothetical protein
LDIALKIVRPAESLRSNGKRSIGKQIGSFAADYVPDNWAHEAVAITCRQKFLCLHKADRVHASIG